MKLGVRKRKSYGLATCLVLAAILAWSSTVTPGSAQASTQTLSKQTTSLPPLRTRLQWTGTVCQQVTPLQTRLAARTAHVQFVPSDEELRLTLSITKVEQGLLAQLSLRSGLLQDTDRTLLGQNCDELLNAVALVAAIALDNRWEKRKTRVEATEQQKVKKASSRSRSRSSNNRRRRRPKRTPAPIEKIEPAVAKTVPSEPEVAILPVPNVAEAEPQKPNPVVPTQLAATFSSPPPPSPPHWIASISADARVAGGIAPQWVAGAGLSGHLRWRGPGGWSPQIGVEYAQYYRNNLDLGEGAADFRILQWAVDVCPMQLLLASFSLSPCGNFQWGSLTAEGREVFSPRRLKRPWRAVGGQLRLQGKLVGALRFQVAGGASFPLVRDRFGFEGGEQFHRTAFVIPRFELGLVWSFL